MIRITFLLPALLAAGLTIAAARAAPLPTQEIPADQTVGFLDSKVQREDHSVIGRTVNLMIKDGTPHAAVIELAGFMGVGVRTAVVPWDQLRFDPAAEPAPVTIHLSADQIRILAKARPAPAPAAALSSGAAPPGAPVPPASSPDAPSAQAAAPQPQASPPQPSAPVGAATPSAADAPPAKNAATLPAANDASKLIDATLSGADGKMVGTLTDVLIDRAGKPRAVVVSLGSTIDPAARDIAVTWSSIRFADIKGKPTITVGLTPEQANTAPAYKSDQATSAIDLPPPSGEPAATPQ